MQERLQSFVQFGSGKHPGILHGLATGGGQNLSCRLHWPRWWRCLVLQTRRRLLRRVLKVVRVGPSAVSGRNPYQKSPCHLGLGNVGREWIFPELPSTGVALPPHEFVQRACCQVMRRRRRLDAVSPGLQRVIGFAAWKLHACKDVNATIITCPGGTGM